MTGALLYAFDSDIKYTKIAVECAKRINQYLNIPVSLVTDATINEQVFDQVIIVDKPQQKITNTGKTQTLQRNGITVDGAEH